jgi:hypothetical protein
MDGISLKFSLHQPLALDLRHARVESAKRYMDVRLSFTMNKESLGRRMGVSQSESDVLDAE